MNKLTLSALCLGGLLQACVATGEAGFDVSWEVTPACPAGAAVEIHAQDIISKKIFTDIYNCTDGLGTMTRLPLADYDIWVDVTNTDGSLLLAQSVAVAAALDFDGDLIRVDLPTFSVDEGTFGFTWTLTDGVGATTCADVFADEVQMEATMVNSNAAIRVGRFSCDAAQAVSDPIAVGQYSIFVDLLQDGDTTPLASSVERSSAIEFGNQHKDLGNFEFVFQ